MFTLLISLVMAIGDTSMAPLYRLGISLEKHEANVVEVYESSHFKTFIPYSTNHRIIDAVNSVGSRLYVVAENSGVYFTGDINKGEWEVESNFRNFIGSTERFESTRGIDFIKKTPVVRSIWYVYGDYGIIRMQSSVPTQSKMHLYLKDVPVYSIATISDTELVALVWEDSLWMVSISGDSVQISPLGVIQNISKLTSTSMGIFAYGPAGLFKVYPTFSSTPVFQDTVNAITEISSTLYAATNRGVFLSSDGGNTWSDFAMQDKKVSFVGSNEDTLFIVPCNDSGVYYSVAQAPPVIYALWPSYFVSHGISLVSSLVNVSGVTYFATPMGPFFRSGDRLLNKAGATPDKLYFDNISTEIVDTFLSVLSFADSLYEQLVAGVINEYNLNLPEYVNILLYPIYQYVNTDNDFILDYLPFYGYAQKNDSSLDDIIAVNTSLSFPLTWESFLELPISERKTILSYNLLKLALLYKMPDESQPMISGLAAFLTQHSGFDLTKGFVESSVEFATDFNEPLLAGSQHHPDALDIREVDRERLLYFFEFLYENYGEAVISRIMNLNAYSGYSRIEQALDTSLSVVLKNWAINNITGGYSIDTTFRVIPASQPLVVPLSMYSTYYIDVSPGLSYSLNIQDNITDDFYTMLYDSSGVADLNYSDTLRKYSRIYSASNDRVIVISNGTPNYYYIAFSTDTIAPDTPRLYVVQNSGFVPYLDIYSFATEELYNDVGTSVEVKRPLVVMENEDTVYRIAMGAYGRGDSLYVYRLHDYFPLRGDFSLLVQAEDIYGNVVSSKSYPVSIFTINGSGSYAILGGRATLIIPDKLNPTGVKVVTFYSEGKNSRIYTIGSSNMQFAEEIALEFTVPSNWKFVRVSQWEDNRWVEIGTYRQEKSKVTITSKNLGTFMLMSADGEDSGSIDRGEGIKVYSGGGCIYLSLPDKLSGNTEISVYTLTGSRIYSRTIDRNGEKASDARITISLPNSGIYYVVVRNGGKKYISRSVVIR